MQAIFDNKSKHLQDQMQLTDVFSTDCYSDDIMDHYFDPDGQGKPKSDDSFPSRNPIFVSYTMNKYSDL